VRYYEQENANIHRGVHFLSELATSNMTAHANWYRKFVNAAHVHELIFVRGATEAINLVAQTYGRKHVTSGDEVLITAMEHTPTSFLAVLCDEKGAKLRVAPINDAGELRLDEF